MPRPKVRAGSSAQAPTHAATLPERTLAREAPPPESLRAYWSAATPRGRLAS